MSLQVAAQHLSSHGRGNDSTLVHMSPREVKSLNDIAMAHGGQLSINPNTGLPEAGFLESILPMVAGAALVASGVGAPMAAMMVGGGMTLATGSLEKGLMAGLGAYGGANLGGGLLASGTDAAVASAPEVAAAQQNAATQMQNFYDPTSQLLKPGGMEAIQKASMDASTAQAAARTAAAPDFMGKLQAMGKGIGSLGQEGGLSSLYQNLGGNPMSLISKVGSAAAPAIGAMMTPKKQEEEKADADMGQRYGFSMNPTGGQPQQVQPGQNPLDNPQTPTTTPFPQPDPYGREQRYFAPAYSKLTPEEAREKYGYADGGITGSGNLDLHIPLDLGGGSGGSYSASTGGSNTYPFQSSGGFTGYNNTTQVEPQAQQPIQQTQQAQQPAQENQDDSSIFGNITMMADGGTTTEYRPTETPAMQAFKQMQAQRAAQAQTQAPQVDANAQYADYLKQTMGGPAQMPTAPTMPAPTTTNLASSGYAYDPIKQQYGQIQGTFEDEKAKKKKAAPFTYTGNRGGMGASAPPRSGFNRAAGGSISDAGYNLGGYSDGGRLLRGPGDGVSDSIPAVIGKKQPARLADGEFVVPARIVSELGNGSTEAGARKLYAMMDRIQSARRKTVGKGKVAKNSRSEKYLPA